MIQEQKSESPHIYIYMRNTMKWNWWV